MVFEGSLDALTGPNSEIEFLKNFPKVLYKTYEVPGLGSFYLDSRADMIKDRLRSGIGWEGFFQSIMASHIKAGTTVIDIGAHIGTQTVAMAKLTGPKGRVISFEPQMKMYAELVMNSLLNDCTNVVAYRCALGAQEQTIEMNPSMAGNEGATAIGQGGDEAQMISLDSLHLDNVSFIKLDVENYEYEVLLGALDTIRRNRPYIILEVMGNTYRPIDGRNELVHRTLNLLKEEGYKLLYIEGSWSDWLAIPTKEIALSNS